MWQQGARRCWWGGLLPMQGHPSTTQRQPNMLRRWLLKQRGPWTNCGRSSTIASRRQPANASLKSMPLTNDRRPLIANNSLTSKLLVNTRRLFFANAVSTSASPWKERLNVPPWHEGWWSALWCWWKSLLPMSIVAGSWQNPLQMWWTWSWPMSSVAMRRPNAPRRWRSTMPRKRHLGIPPQWRRPNVLRC
jgi:hypothetical protein